MKYRFAVVAVALLMGVGVLKAEDKKPACMMMGKGAMPTKAVCSLSSASGSSVSGYVTFEQKGDDVEVGGEVKGLTPGEHGFHIHDNGDCTAPDAASAGGHFNPTGMPHGALDAKEHHMGDMGNVKANQDGVAKIRLRMKGVMLCAILGRGVIVHGKVDDLKSQPAGNAGPRVACGVIGAISSEVAKK